MTFNRTGFREVGGIDELWRKYATAVGIPDSIRLAAKNLTTPATTIISTMASVSVATTAANITRGNVTDTSGCYGVDPNWNHMFRPYDDKEYPWIGLWFSLPVTGIWYWCTDQVIFGSKLSSMSFKIRRPIEFVSAMLENCYFCNILVLALSSEKSTLK